MVFHGPWQTGFVDETEAAKVERVKQEKGIFWKPFANVNVEEAKRSSLQVWADFNRGQTLTRQILPLLLTDETNQCGFQPHVEFQIKQI